MKQVAVIGGGAAGLVAAWQLARAGHAVTLFERGAQVGGRARSDSLDGCIVDVGAQLFGSGFSTLFNLAADAGAADLLVKSPGRDAVYRRGRMHPITYGSVSSMVTSGALPATLKLKLGARYVPFLLRHATRLDAGDPVGSGGAALDNDSVAHWGRAELGDDFVELLAYPLLGAYYGSAPEQTSVALYHALARAGLDVSVHAVRGGTGALMQAFADAARAHGATLLLDTEVQRVQREGNGWNVVVSGEARGFDAVVLAVPAPQIAPLLELPAATAQWLSAVRFAPSAVLAVQLSRSLPADFFGLSLLRTEREVSDVVAICVQARKAADLVPWNQSLLTCLSAPEKSAELLADPERAVQRMLAVVERVFPDARGHVSRVKLYRHAFGYPVFYPGYLKHLRSFDAQPLPDGVQLAGDYLVSPTVEGALRSGLRAADRTAAYLAR